jgi:hypothetical protein
MISYCYPARTNLLEVKALESGDGKKQRGEGAFI